MKSFLPYLIFSVLLVICYYEKKAAWPSPKDALGEPFVAPRLYKGKFASPRRTLDISAFQMRPHINNNFRKERYRPASSMTAIVLFGALSDENELILAGSANTSGGVR